MDPENEDTQSQVQQQEAGPGQDAGKGPEGQGSPGGEDQAKGGDAGSQTEETPQAGGPEETDYKAEAERLRRENETLRASQVEGIRQRDMFGSMEQLRDSSGFWLTIWPTATLR